MILLAILAVSAAIVRELIVHRWFEDWSVTE